MNIEDSMSKTINFKNISIAIPTNGRPNSLRNCLVSIVKNIHMDCPILVLDSTPADSDKHVIQDYEKLYSEFPDVKLLKYDKNVPPGHARKILSKNVKTEFVLFLDDDLEVGEKTFEKMFNALINDNYDIISGLWVEKKFVRPPGFLFTEATNNGQKMILKCAVGLKKVPSDAAIQLHDVQASLLARTSVFSRVNFDERYDFFYELYDFFYQCRLQNIRIGVHTGAVFYHHPGPYLTKSSRYYQKQEIDRERFTDKWGLLPEFAYHQKDNNSLKDSILSSAYLLLKKSVLSFSKSRR